MSDTHKRLSSGSLLSQITTKKFKADSSEAADDNLVSDSTLLDHSSDDSVTAEVPVTVHSEISADAVVTSDTGNDTAATDCDISAETVVSSVCAQLNDLGTCSPKQPVLAQYPSTLCGKKHRRFQKVWYTGRPWLEYSVQLDACFCYCCRIFTKDNDPDADPCFTTTGFRNWKTAQEEGRGHCRSCPVSCCK